MAVAVVVDADTLDSGLAEHAAAAGLLPAAGRPLALHVIDALRGCGNIERVVLAGSFAYRDHRAVLDAVDDVWLTEVTGGALIASAFDRWGDAEEWLWWPPNAPLVSTMALEHWLRHAPTKVALNLAAVREARIRAALPGLDDTQARSFAGEVVAFAPPVLLRPGELSAHGEVVRAWLAEGSATDKLGVLGTSFSIKVTTGRAGLSEICGRLGQRLDSRCAVTLVPFGEWVLRVTDRNAYHLARGWLETLA